MNNKQKLELTWIGKDEEIKAEPRILLYDKENSYGDQDTENMLIHGDNLLALKALEQDYTGKIKCIYIDPPYNTGSAFEYYDDNLEHSTWLSLMKPRLQILKNLLSNNGFFCCHIDDSEGHYLKVLLDELFGRNNYLTTLYIRVRYPDKTLKEDMDFHKEIEQIHIYRKTPASIPNLEKQDVGFEKFIYRIKELSQPQSIELGGKRVDIFTKEQYEIEKYSGDEYGLKEIWASGTILDGNSSGRFFRDYFTGRYEDDGYGVMYKVYGIGDDRYDYRYFTGPNKVGATKGKYYQGVPLDKLESKDMTRTIPVSGFFDLAGSFGNCRTEGGAAFRGGKKPEALLEMVLKYFSDENDYVLDSFLGSGTTAAVAHKMGRKYIGIELGEHCYSLCKPRLERVIDGDKTGISKSQNWTGGGGFKFYELAPSLLKEDRFGNLVIDEDVYNADLLAAAVAKLNGYKYSPHEKTFWKQGTCSENAFIFTTTEYVNADYLDKLSKELDFTERLLVCCPAFDLGMDNRYDNIEIKKIPKSVLDKCEYGKDNYNLNIIDTTEIEEDCEEWDND